MYVHRQEMCVRGREGVHPDDALENAIRSGSLELVQYIVSIDRGAISDGMYIFHACHVAVKYGHLEILRWLVANGFLVCNKEGQRHKALKRGYRDISEWLTDNT